MRIDGEWYKCDDGFIRPVLRGTIMTARGTWESAPFLIDTGADRTVLSASIHEILGYAHGQSLTQLGGVGGVAIGIEFEGQIRLMRNDGGVIDLRGMYAALTQFESLDMSVLGRDILGLFAVIVGQQHGYVIQTR